MSKPTKPHLDAIPKELIIHISDFLPTADLNNYAQASSTFHNLLNKPLYRRNVIRNNGSALVWAVTRNQKGTALAAIDAGADMLTITDADPDIKGCTLLMLAAYHGSTSILELLLDNDDINPNSRDRKYIRPPLTWAVVRNHRSVVRTLLKNDRVDVNLQDKNGNTPLHFAVDRKRPEIIALLLGSGRADPRVGNRQGGTAVSRAARWSDTDTELLLGTHLRLILDGDDSEEHCQHVFFYAAITGQLEIVKYLVSFFAEKLDPNGGSQGHGRGAFSNAVDRDHTEVVRYLLSWDKTNPNLRDTWQHQTPLFVAAKNGQNEMVEVLVQSDRVDLDLPDVHGTSPLGVASETAHERVVKSLVKGQRRADPNARDKYGQTPLVKASLMGYIEIINVLLDTKGIDPTLADSDGLTPLDVAKENGHTQVADRLQEYIDSLGNAS